MTDPLYQFDESRLALCPELYSRLHNTFPGGVIIANQGENFHCGSGLSFGGQRFTSVYHSGEYYRVNCPFCQDTRHRLWINHMYGQPDVNRRPMRFLAICYNEGCMQDPEKWRRLNDAIFGFRNASERRQQQFAVRPPEWDTGALQLAEPPGRVIPMSHLARSMPNHLAVQYMCGERHYTTHMFDHYSIGFCEHANPKFPAAQNRIVFPIYMDGQMVGWQARYIGTTDWRTTPKYYGLPGMKKRRMLYNFDYAKDKPFVVIVEGPTDSNVVGDCSVALMGKSMSMYQYQLILNQWAGKPVILILDPDAREEMRGILTDMRHNDVVVVEVLLPEGYDCGDYDRTSLWNIIYAQTRSRGVILPAA